MRITSDADLTRMGAIPTPANLSELHPGDMLLSVSRCATTGELDLTSIYVFVVLTRRYEETVDHQVCNIVDVLPLVFADPSDVVPRRFYRNAGNENDQTVRLFRVPKR